MKSASLANAVLELKQMKSKITEPKVLEALKLLDAVFIDQGNIGELLKAAGVSSQKELYTKIWNDFMISFLKSARPEFTNDATYEYAGVTYAIKDYGPMKLKVDVNSLGQAGAYTLESYGVEGDTVYLKYRAPIKDEGVENLLIKHQTNNQAFFDALKELSAKIVKTDLTRDEILYNGLLYHIKPAMYRIKNNIQITNSVFQELIIEKDPILDVVNKAVQEIEELFEVKFPEDEIALMGFHIKASIERNTCGKTKKVILICGLGYGSSKVLEHSLKENYDLDIVDVLPYYLIKTSMPNYANIDLILSTIDLEESYDIPVVKINPLPKEEDFILLSKYGIRKNITKVSLKQIMDIIENNVTIKDKDKLVNELKNKLENKIIDDLSEVGIILKEMLNRNNVQFVDQVKDWKEAITKAGDILEKNNVIKHDYVEEMIKLIEKHGAYIVIEEGMAIPHAPISENVLKAGISLLVVKEKVLFPNGKGANIFLSFATTNNIEHLGILNDLFELITKYNFIEKISKITDYEELEEYFRKELVC